MHAVPFSLARPAAPHHAMQSIPAFSLMLCTLCLLPPPNEQRAREGAAAGGELRGASFGHPGAAGGAV